MNKEKELLASDKICVRHELDFLTIRPIDDVYITPIDCPVCKILMKDDRDTYAFRRYKCCSECMFRWAQPRIDDWEDGWRPDEDEILNTLADAHPSQVYFVR